MTARTDPRQTPQAVAETRATFVAALGRADAEALAALYTADATLFPPGAAPISGREAVRRFWQAGLDAGIVSIRLEAIGLDHDERLAYELGRYELRLETIGAGIIVDCGSYLLVHERQADGAWNRCVEVFTPTP